MVAIAYSWFIPLLPWIAFAIIGLLLSAKHKSIAAIASIGCTALSLLLSFAVGYEYFRSEAAKQASPILSNVFTWLTFSSTTFGSESAPLDAKFGILLDPISVLLSVIVCTISLFAQIYSYGYLHGHPGVKRFYCFISLFTGAMLGLVLSVSLIQIYVFWELVGLGSFLLIGFYYDRAAAVSACKKAFIVTRFADLGFLLGILLISYHVGSFDFAVVIQKAQHLPAATVSLACLLITLGAFGKSAMFPLHIWLPDAMEGPTPVSALIHAATMVVAGVYLIARLFGLFLLAPEILEFIAYVGAFTALFAAVIACTQNDIKRVLAFSTLSQIGYMMLALGVSRGDSPLGYSASMFHLTTHAFFKALLFLAAGAVIHAVHTNDIWKMGKLAKKMPLTHGVFLIGCLAITALPPYLVSGFYSKDELLYAVFRSGHSVLFSIAVGVAFLTSFYMFRLYYLVFFGTSGKEESDAHDPPLSMGVPLFALALLSIIAGWFPVTEYVFYGGKHLLEHETISPVFVWSITAYGALGWFFADLLYRRKPNLPSELVNGFGSVYRVVSRKFYIDEVYLFITKKIIFDRISLPLEQCDKRIVDGSVDFTGNATVNSGAALRLLSTGRVAGHAVTIVIGMIGLLIIVLGFS